MHSFTDHPRVPVIDFEPFEAGGRWRDHVARQLDWACSQFGFFQVVGHRVEEGSPDRLARLSRAAAEDWDISLGYGATAPVGRVPPFPGLQDAAFDYLMEITSLAQHLMSAMGRGLGLGDHYFFDHLTANAIRTLRVSRSLRAPMSALALNETVEPGLLTVLHQNELAQLRFRHRRSWIEIPQVPHSFLVGVGSTLERLTERRYRAATWRGTGSEARGDSMLWFSFRPQIDFVDAAGAPRDADSGARSALRPASRTHSNRQRDLETSTS